MNPTLPSGSGSSQMLPPTSLPPSRLSSPALRLQLSALPSPVNSAAPSPQLSALPFPLIDPIPVSYGSPLHPNQSPATSFLYPPPVGPTTPRIFQPASPSSQGDWPQDLQRRFEIQVARLTAAAGLPLSWVDNPEWIDLVHQFLPAAKSPSRKILTTRLIPNIVEEYRTVAKESSRSQNATIQADGWTGVNFHHLLAFMIAVKKKVRSTPRQQITHANLTCQTHTVSVHDASCERKTADNLKIHLEKVIDTVRVEYRASVVGIVTDASGECRKARRLLALEHPDIVFLDCYAHQVFPFYTCAGPHTDLRTSQVNLVVGDYFKSEAEALTFADQASDLIAWLRSKTLILALMRDVQAALPGAKISEIKTIIRAVLTRWTMHYQSYRRLRELHTTILMVVDLDENRPEEQRCVITGDTRAKTKARGMVQLIKDERFWHALAVYVKSTFFRDRVTDNHPGWNGILNRSQSQQTLPRQHTAVWTLCS